MSVHSGSVRTTTRSRDRHDAGAYQESARLNQSYTPNVQGDIPNQVDQYGNQLYNSQQMNYDHNTMGYNNQAAYQRNTGYDMSGAYNDQQYANEVSPYVGKDPGVAVVSHALFANSGSFSSIPLAINGMVFRKRRIGDTYSEWSNAFVTRVDPCECGEPQTVYNPYQVGHSRMPDGSVGTTLDFSDAGRLAMQ